MGIRQKALEEVGSSTSMEIKPRPLVFIFTFLLPLCFSSILPIDETNQGNKARVAYALAKESSNLGACSERILSWSGWNGGLNGAILIHAKDEPDMDDWNVFLVFDKELEDFKCYDGEVDNASGKTFKIRPKAWNAASKAGSRRQIGIGIKWAQNSGEPKLKSMVVNGIPYTCGDGGDTGDAEDLVEIEAEEGEEEEDREEPESSQEVVVPVEQVENVNSERGVYVSWPKKVMGLYVLLADDDHEGFESEAVWEPRLYEWQQKAANVLFFTFIHPVTMDVPPSFANLAKTRGTGVEGAIPADTVILFAIGGYAYSSKIKPWHWLESQEAAEAMAERVAKWPEEYGIDGIDLDLEDGAGDTPKAGPNMIHFVRKLRTLQPKMIIGQPTYGFPQVKAEIAVINASWKNGQSTNLADSVGLMVYQGTQALNYVKNYATASSQWSGFPIQTDVPKNCILLGAKGAASASTLNTLAKASLDNDYLGIMVWYASVKNGLQYAVTWDASESQASIDAYVEIGQKFRQAS